MPPLQQPQEPIPSAELLAPSGMLRIAHQGALYTLRATRNGGLILTK